MPERLIDAFTKQIVQAADDTMTLRVEFFNRPRDHTLRINADVSAGSFGVQLDGDGGAPGADRATLSGPINEYDIDLVGLAKEKRTIILFSRDPNSVLEFIEFHAM